MRCYLVVVKPETGEPVKTYCGTQADVSAVKKAFMNQGGKRKDVSVAEVEIPNAKGELIEFINSLVNG